jgi:hypothetical protein
MVVVKIFGGKSKPPYMACGIKVRFVNTPGKIAVPRITAEGYI